VDSHIEMVIKKYSDLFEKKAFAQLATLMADGSPQVSPVWVDYVDDYILINSARGRLKDKNIERDPRVAVAVQDPDNAYRKLLIRGRVIEITTEGADAHIDKMAKKYLGVESYPNRRQGEVRVIYKIIIEHATG
jgi:PPOX class probable F420-dependent enzyme